MSAAWVIDDDLIDAHAQRFSIYDTRNRELKETRVTLPLADQSYRAPFRSSPTFTFLTELMHIALGAIPSPNSEPSLLSSPDENSIPSSTFYIDDIFDTHDSVESQWGWLFDHLLTATLFHHALKALEKGLGLTTRLALVLKVGTGKAILSLG
ncbi:hypothetical protein M426DRAFT_13876 [Hypoxylon sp. CI-4A]|nr:hypothetical protein M426DRAFT_13876 [Hypoxylon sp. CI-4A]